jgi:putative transposase
LGATTIERAEAVVDAAEEEPEEYGYLSQFAVISDGKTSDIQAARGLSYTPGTMLVFNRGYQHFRWWLELSRQKVFFVTRLKDNAEYGIVEQRPSLYGL